ncbi:xanthine dehydrogenase family protein molybdopterin-binding subunit [Gemmata massiliana]|uniref:xanthine dehydrogenase family protein molybdopterin-binding subunit n=1 Tax=Gemmata massiliana TaxID=1210884 RepID=UPI0036F2680C
MTVPDPLKPSGGPVGKPVSRVDGPLKVTGAAKYAAEFRAEGMLYGVVVSAAVARGAIETIDAAAALAVPGVVRVFTHENRPRTAWFDSKWRDEVAPPGSPFRPLYDEHVHYSGQPVALVVADTFEAARYAASLVTVACSAGAHETDLKAARAKAATPPKFRMSTDEPAPRGNADRALKAAAVRVDAEYTQPAEFHNPMEAHATTAVYESDGALTVYDKIQGAANSQTFVCNVFGLAKEKVRVVSPFVGGAFGSGLRPQYQLFLAVMGALELKRPVRVVLTRQQMFTFGHRPETLQSVSLGAGADGALQAIAHEAVAETSRYEDYTENLVNWSGMAYRCDHVKLGYKLAKLDVATPCDMRAPGATTGVFALECAMDELAHAAGVDPVELRLRNYAEKDQVNDRPYSSKELRACYREGAAKFGWAARNPVPRSTRRGTALVGWGMAGGMWDAFQQPASARAVLSADGTLTASSATADIGTGTYTVMTQIAAEALGLPVEAVAFKLGDSSLPAAPIEGGSWTVSSVGTAVKAACDGVREEALALARKLEDSPLAKAELEDVIFADGHIGLKTDASKRLALADVLKRSGVAAVEKTVEAVPNLVKQQPYSRAAHGAAFVEVEVDEDFGTVKVTRVVSAVAAGRIINPKTARSQILGAVVWGIGMALHEAAAVDHALGRVMNHNYGEYHVPVHADVPDIGVIFVDEPDDVVNPLGAKGVGEIGIVGVAAAVANAVFHATGKRVRDLPITLDKLL